TKSGKVPEIYQDIMDEFLVKLGYRFELKNVTVNSVFNPGSNLTISSLWMNTGSAPSYNNYSVAWKLTNVITNTSVTFNTKNDITNWYPSYTKNDVKLEYLQKNTFSLPTDLKQGKYNLQVALVDKNQQPKINLAIKGKNNDKWYNIGFLYIK
ncbi:DUF4832 domain-containing protein, partial [Photobacterium damselae]|uniref:DUF4832 domain-containing protein n=1 Tax=Photobacterium damselae TaxID=38293 RepID=UPI002F3EF079